MHTRRARRAALASLTAAMALSVAACGSNSTPAPTSPTTSSGSSSASPAGSVSAATAGSGAPSGTPIKLMVIADLASPAYSVPEVLPGAQAAVNKLNDGGGINGHPVQLLNCNSQNDPNVAAACGRKAVSENVSAVVGMVGLQSSAVDAVLEKANIPSVGGDDIGALDRTSPISFPLISTPAILFSIVPAIPDADKCQHPGVLSTDIPAANEAADVIKKYYSKVAGAPTVTVVSVPVSATNISAQVSTLLNGGTDCAFLLDPATLDLAAIKDIYNSGKKVKIAASAAALPVAQMQQLGAAAQGVYATTPFYLPGGASKSANEFSTRMTAVDPKATQDVLAQGGYAGVLIVAQALKSMTDFSAPKVLAQLNKMTNIDVGIAPVIPSFPADTGVKGQPRIFGYNLFNYVFNGNNYELAQTAPLNVLDQLKSLIS